MIKLRILVGADVPPDPNSGAAGTVVHTNQALRELGHEVDEFWAKDMPRRVNHGNLHYLLELPYEYRRIVRKRYEVKKYDVIQLSQPHAWLAAQDNQIQNRHSIFINRSHGVEPRVEEIVHEWRKRLNLPENRFPRSLLSEILHKILDRHWPKVIRFSDGIIVPCEDDKEYLISKFGVNSAKIRTIHHGVPQLFLELEPPPFTSERMGRLLHVAQFSFFKGQNILVPIVNQILTAFSNITFTWVCPSSQHNAAISLFDSSIIDRVEMMDWMTQKDLISVYDNHGIFIFTSIVEGAAKATLEAMSRGLCVIASNNSGMKDYIKHGRNGMLVPVGEINTFVSNIYQLLADPMECKRISVEARLSALRYSWQRCAEKAVSFYKELFDRNNSCKAQ